MCHNYTYELLLGEWGLQSLILCSRLPGPQWVLKNWYPLFFNDTTMEIENHSWNFRYQLFENTIKVHDTKCPFSPHV